jgi:hypothetical protein
MRSFDVAVVIVTRTAELTIACLRSFARGAPSVQRNHRSRCRRRQCVRRCCGNQTRFGGRGLAVVGHFDRGTGERRIRVWKQSMPAHKRARITSTACAMSLRTYLSRKSSLPHSRSRSPEGFMHCASRRTRYSSSIAIIRCGRASWAKTAWTVFLSLEQCSARNVSRSTLKPTERWCASQARMQSRMCSTCSKNVQSWRSTEHIVAHRINWKSKSENIASLASELNLGLHRRQPGRIRAGKGCSAPGSNLAASRIGDCAVPRPIVGIRQGFRHRRRYPPHGNVPRKCGAPVARGIRHRYWGFHSVAGFGGGYCPSYRGRMTREWPNSPSARINSTLQHFGVLNQRCVRRPQRQARWSCE